jgi:hypothetical protein
LNRNESGRFGALKSDSTHHFFRNACTKGQSKENRRGNHEWAIKKGQSRMDNQEGAITNGQSRRGNHEWTIKKGQSRMDNQDGAIPNGQSDNHE